jgi:hypothetical protein
MQTQTVNASTAEIVYGNFTNVAGATITTGMPVSITTTAASLNGNNAVLPATGNLRTFFGVAASDVADTAVGRAICYGYAASVKVFAHGASVTSAIDIAIGPGVAGSNGFSSTGLIATFGPLVTVAAIGAITNSAGGYVRGLVRAM